MGGAVFAKRASECAAEKGVEVGLGRKAAPVRYISDRKIRVREQPTHLFELFPPYGGGDAFAVHCGEPQLKKAARYVKRGGEVFEGKPFRGGRQSTTCMQADELLRRGGQTRRIRQLARRIAFDNPRYAAYCAGLAS